MLGFNGGLIGTDRTTALVGASGVWTLNEQIKARRTNIWPTTAIGYRYIRWTITAQKVPGTNSVQVSEFNLINGATNIDMSGANIVASPTGSVDPNFIKDGNTATKWIVLTSNAPLPHFFTFDMGDVTAFTSYRWATANDTPARDPVSWTVAGSLDNTTFTTLDTKTNFAVTDDRFTYVGPFTV